MPVFGGSAPAGCRPWPLLAALLLGCGPGVVVEDVSGDCSPGSCRVTFYVEAREPVIEDLWFEVSVLTQKRGTSAMFKTGSSRVRVRPRQGQRVRAEVVVPTGVNRATKVVVRRLRSP